MPEYFLIGEVKSFFNDGYVLISSVSDFPERFSKLSYFYVDLFGDKRKLKVEDVRIENDIYLKILNFDEEEELSFLLRKKIYVDSENLVELPDGMYFIHDLIGSRVFWNKKFFGYLKDYFQLTSNDVMVIEDIKGEEILIPAISEYVENFDPVQKIVTLVDRENSIYDDEN